MKIVLQPIALVRNGQKEKVDANWRNVISTLELADHLPEDCLLGIEAFSHLEILFYFHQSNNIILGSEHPQENHSWPCVGIFSQRKKDRPNHLGVSVVNLLRRDGNKLIVTNLDAIDGTPIIDIKPVYVENLPKGEIKQPQWSRVLMKGYW
jgi:tRNA-Thr(GGU) m(6)t(6)A37 methyltransferase TsaA